MSQLNRIGASSDESILWPSHEQETEAQLLARVRAHDEEASTVFVRKYSGRMLAVARRLLRRDEDSADAVQDAFLAVFRSLDNFEGKSALRNLAAPHRGQRLPHETTKQVAEPGGPN